jgi:hypothetical protein
MIDIEEAKKFIDIVIPPSLRAQGSVILKEWGARSDCSRLQSDEDLQRVLTGHCKCQSGLAVGIAIRTSHFIPQGKSQGSKKDCFAIQALKLDFDAPKPAAGEKKQPLTKSKKSRIRDSLLSAPQKPTILIDSGGGLHAYYVLEQPIVLVDQVAIDRVERINTNIIRYFSRQGLPCIVDQAIKDVSRIMRLPGSINYRYDEPMPVKIVEIMT